MNKLEKAKGIIKEHISQFCDGIFNTRNVIGDPMETIYEDEGITIDVCWPYCYFEVFGLTDEEFGELEEYYRTLRETLREEDDDSLRAEGVTEGYMYLTEI